MERIITKVPWNALRILSSVSCAWRPAVESGEGYDARALSGSTQAAIVLLHPPFISEPTLESFLGGGGDLLGNDVLLGNDNVHKSHLAISLYFIEENAGYHLPSLPVLKGGIPYGCGCHCWNEKLYILGGRAKTMTIAEVYVLYLAGMLHRRKCSSMVKPRQEFGCDVVDGKIYVFGGSCESLEKSFPLADAEVYDLDEIKWSSYDMFLDKSKGGDSRKGAFRHKGTGWLSEDVNLRTEMDDFNDDVDESFPVLFAEVYHTGYNEWRKVQDFTRVAADTVVIVDTVIHRISTFGIYVYDMLSNSWKFSQCSLDLSDPVYMKSLAALALMAICGLWGIGTMSHLMKQTIGQVLSEAGD